MGLVVSLWSCFCEMVLLQLSEWTKARAMGLQDAASATDEVAERQDQSQGNGVHGWELN
jgi:hypothetical protein